MKYLKLTESTNPQLPSDGNPYVYYNRDIDTVWIALGVRWILETGEWMMQKQWDNNGRWNFFGPLMS